MEVVPKLGAFYCISSGQISDRNIMNTDSVTVLSYDNIYAIQSAKRDRPINSAKCDVLPALI